MAAACEVFASNSWFTLQNPVGRSGIPSSSSRKAPQAPAPVSTGERMASRLSWPLPRCINTPGMRLRASAAWVRSITPVMPGSRRERLAATRQRASSRRCAVTTTSVSSAGSGGGDAAADCANATVGSSATDNAVRDKARAVRR